MVWYDVLCSDVQDRISVFLSHASASDAANDERGLELAVVTCCYAV
jgi:hypothetical protein